MKYVHYKTSDAAGGSDEAREGVCHKSKLEYLAAPGVAVSFEPVSDEDYAALVEKWNGVETAPAAKAKPKKVA